MRVAETELAMKGHILKCFLIRSIGLWGLGLGLSLLVRSLLVLGGALSYKVFF